MDQPFIKSIGWLETKHYAPNLITLYSEHTQTQKQTQTPTHHKIYIHRESKY